MSFKDRLFALPSPSPAPVKPKSDLAPTVKTHPRNPWRTMAPPPTEKPAGFTVLEKVPSPPNVKFGSAEPVLTAVTSELGLTAPRVKSAEELEAELLERVKRRAGLGKEKKGFEALLPSHVVGKLIKLKIKKPSLVQKTVIPFLASGQDAIVSSQTGER